MKKVKCSNPNCQKTFAHILDDNTVDVLRQGHQFTVIGKEFAFIGTCGWCKQKTSLNR